MRTLRNLFLAATALFLVGAPIAQAAGPQFDDGTEFDANDIYAKAQQITDFYSDTALYGRLSGPADVFKIVPDRDGDQTLSLIARDLDATAQPYLVLVDPTDATTEKQLSIPTPSEEYHTALLKPIEGLETYNEPASFDSYTLIAQQRVAFKKDTTYYVIIFDPARKLDRYALKLGEGKVWSIQNAFKYAGGWIKLRSDVYGGSTPFHATPATFGFVLFFLALAVLTGMWVIEEVFSFMANRNKMAGYILIKMQKFSRIIVWVSLWFMALGGYIYFDATSWIGIPFVLTVLFIPLLAVFLLRTLVLSPKLMVLEVSKQEAVIPLPLRKMLYAYFVLTVVVLGTFFTLLTVHVAR